MFGSVSPGINEDVGQRKNPGSSWKKADRGNLEGVLDTAGFPPICLRLSFGKNK